MREREDMNPGGEINSFHVLQAGNQRALNISYSFALFSHDCNMMRGRVTHV